MKCRTTIYLLASLWLWGSVLFAQPYVGDAASTYQDVVNHDALGITILGSPNLAISSISDYQNGVSVNHNTLQLVVPIGLSWSLQVRALDDLRYQTQSIPVSSIAVQSLNLGNRPEILLTTTNQTIASGMASSALNIINLIRYRTMGGSNFLKPAGAYTTTLVFTYTAL